jgi:hypothetical protein
MSGEASTSPTTILDAPIAPESPTPAVVIPGRLSDDEKAKRRAEWLHEHGAPPNCVLLTVEEIKVLSEAIDEAKRETAAAKESAEFAWKNTREIDRVRVQAETDRDRLKVEIEQAHRSPRIYTRCPACQNDTLTINDDKHLLCTWIKCPDPTAIDKVNASKATLEAERDKLRAELAAARGHIEHEESFALAVAREAD